MRDLTKYFLLTFTISWACFVSLALLSHKFSSLNIFLQIFGLLGTITPSLVALWLTAQNGLPGQTQLLINKIVKWNVPIKWYVFAAGFMATIKFFVAIIYRVTTGAWPVFGKEAWYIMVIAILFSTWVQAGEEIGWRGFALPRMTEKFGLPLAALLLGVIWACWHLPLFYVLGANTYGQSFPLYLLQVIAVSVIVAWLYWRTGGSLLLAMLLHASINNTKDIVPSAVAQATHPFALSHSPVAWLTVALLWIFASYCLYHMRSIKLLE